MREREREGGKQRKRERGGREREGGERDWKDKREKEGKNVFFPLSSLNQIL